MRLLQWFRMTIFYRTVIKHQEDLMFVHRMEKPMIELLDLEKLNRTLSMKYNETIPIEKHEDDFIVHNDLPNGFLLFFMDFSVLWHTNVFP